MSYNNHPAYDQAQLQQQQQQQQLQYFQQQQQQYVAAMSNSIDRTTGSIPRGVPPPPPSQQQHQQQQQSYPPIQGSDNQQQFAVWTYQQHQQNMLRYSAQPQPPTYPPPAYAYPQYHSYPHGTSPQMVPTPRGYYGYPQPPAPAAISAYANVQAQQQHQASIQHNVAPPPGAIYSRSSAQPPTPVTAPPPAETYAAQQAPAQQKSQSAAPEGKAEVKTKQPIVVGKRRGGRVLPTGVVKKQKVETPQQVRKDPWSQYMHEVKRYKDESCDDGNSKNRPLVK